MVGDDYCGCEFITRGRIYAEFTNEGAKFEWFYKVLVEYSKGENWTTLIHFDYSFGVECCDGLSISNRKFNMRILAVLFLGFVLFACEAIVETEADKAEEKMDEAYEEAYHDLKEEQLEGYDSVYAQELGADQYGMHQYVMAFLKKGPNRDLDSPKAMELQMAHMDNIGRLAEEGKLVLAGPFLDDGDLRGIYIFDAKTIEEAEAWTNSDPAVQAGSLIMELHPWYGSAGVMAINEIHKKIAEIEI